MNRKQLGLLLVLLVVLGGASLFLMRREDASWRAPEMQLGAPVLQGFDVNKVATIRFRDSKSTLDLVKKDGGWVIPQRGNYPASGDAVADLLLRLRDLKVLQTETVEATLRGRLDLEEPGKGEHAGTRAEFLDDAGKPIATLLVGKTHRHGGEASGYADGRYVLAGTGDSVAVVASTLNSVEPKAERWLDKRFFRVERIKSIARTDGDAGQTWRLQRDAEGGEMKLVDADPGKKLDMQHVNGALNAVATLTLQDVEVSPDPAKTGLDKAAVIVAETFDGLVYTLKFGARQGDPTKPMDESVYFQAEVAGEPKRERVPGKDEKPDEKERLDKEFKEETAKFVERVTKERGLSKWVYRLNAITAKALLFGRGDLYEVPRPAPTPVAPGADAPPGHIDLSK